MEEILFRLTGLPEITHAHSFATGDTICIFRKASAPWR